MSGLRRLFQIGFAVGAYLLWWLLVRLHLWRPSMTPAQRLCRTFERLGTTFVKLGQGLSLHRDLLPDEYIRALQGLQDRVAPFPDAIARREVEQALGKSIAELFAEFEAHPMAAASIAQVHQARLRDGRRVVVKIRRPHIKTQIDRDMRLLRGVLRVLLALFPWLRRHEPLTLVDEVWTTLRKETDFHREARNTLRFVEAFLGLYIAASLLMQHSIGPRLGEMPTLAAAGYALALWFTWRLARGISRSGKLLCPWREIA